MHHFSLKLQAESHLCRLSLILAPSFSRSSMVALEDYWPPTPKISMDKKTSISIEHSDIWKISYVNILKKHNIYLIKKTSEIRK